MTYPPPKGDWGDEDEDDIAEVAFEVVLWLACLMLVSCLFFAAMIGVAP